MIYRKIKLILLLLAILIASCSSNKPLPLDYKKIQVGENATIEIPANMMELWNRSEIIDGNKEFSEQYQSDRVLLEFGISKYSMREYKRLELLKNEELVASKYTKQSREINGKNAIIYSHYGNKILYSIKNLIGRFSKAPNYEDMHSIIIFFPNYTSSKTVLRLEITCYGDDGKQLAHQIIQSIKFDQK